MGRNMKHRLLIGYIVSMIYLSTLATGEGYNTIEEARYALAQELLAKNKECRPSDSLYKRPLENEVAGYVVKLPNGNYDISVPTPKAASVGSVNVAPPENAVESMHTHPYEGIFGGLGLSQTDVNTISSSGIPGFALDCGSGLILGMDASGKPLILTCDESNGTCSSGEMQGEVTDTMLLGTERSTSTEEIKQMYEKWLKEQLKECPDPNSSKFKDLIKAIADLLETGEELAEARQDLRDKRHERHKETPVVDPEPEPTPTPKKKTPKKETPKKTEKKTVDQPKKADTQKTPNTTPNTTGTIDFSKLESLISKQASFIRGILSSGEEASSAQHAQFNSLNKQYSAEFDRLKAQIGKVSDSAKRSEYYNKLASINSRMNSEVDPLLSQGVSRGLFILH